VQVRLAARPIRRGLTVSELEDPDSHLPRRHHPRRHLPAPTTIEAVEARIHVVRGLRVMLDADLAALYSVTTGALNQAVDRNRGRFPDDFAFRLSAEKAEGLKSQIVISKGARGGRRRSTPRAFTEEGVAMLSSVLRSPRAVAANVLIMRAFVRLRRMHGEYAELRHRSEDLEARIGEQLTEIWQALDALETPPSPPRRPLGFRPDPGSPAIRARRRP
jgi:hypothetical protein